MNKLDIIVFLVFNFFTFERKYNLNIWIAFMKFEYNTQYWLNCFRCQVVMVSFPLSPSLTQSRLAWEWPCHSTVAASMLPLKPEVVRRLAFCYLVLIGLSTNYYYRLGHTLCLREGLSHLSTTIKAIMLETSRYFIFCDWSSFDIYFPSLASAVNLSLVMWMRSWAAEAKVTTAMETSSWSSHLQTWWVL